MQSVPLTLLINLHVMSLFIQVLGFKDTYIWIKDDNPKKRGNIRLTKDLNANSKVTFLHFTNVLISNNVL